MRGLDFLRLILPTEGYLVGFARKGEQRRQEAFANIEALIAWQRRWDAEGFDVYHACASFKDKIGAGLRAHVNVLWLCALWLDIDTRESKPGAYYKDREEAREAVLHFCEVAKLPPPLFVSSGGGLHCYWPLASLLRMEDWQYYALGLKQLCEKFALHADPARTADASSILRTLGTHHHKTGRTVREDELIDLYPIELFDHLKDAANERPTSLAKTRDAGAAQPILRKLLNVYGDDPSDPSLIATTCRSFGRFANAPGEFSEPVHYRFAGLCRNCEPGGIEYYVRLLDPEWRDAGRRKAEQWIYGPPTCHEIETQNPGGCDGCPNKITREITSPIILGRGYQFRGTIPNGADTGATQNASGTLKVNGHTFEAAPQSQIALPREFSNETGSLTHVREDNDGQPLHVIVSDFPLELTAIHAAETDGGCTFAFRHKLPHHPWKPISVPAGHLLNGHGLPLLAKGGAIIRDPKLLVQFAHDSARDWNKMNVQKILYEQCGWKDENKAFLAGTQLIRAHTIEEAICNDDLTHRGEALRPAEGGDVREWQRVAGCIHAPDNHPAQFAIMCAFGCIFMPFLANNEGGTILSLLNRLSGVGKSMVLKVCASIWATELDALRLTNNYTGVARGLIMAALGNLPVIYDELANLNSEKYPDALAELVGIFDQGTDRKRGLQSGEGIRQARGIWATMMFSGNNQSLVDQLDTGRRNSDAPGMRVLELPYDAPDGLKHADGEKLEAELFAHGGTAGPAFVQHVLRPDMWEYAQNSLASCAQALWQGTGFGPEARYLIRAMTCAYVGGDIARGLGLIHCDPVKTILWVTEELRERLSPRSQMGLTHESADGLTVLGRYCLEYGLDTLYVTKTWTPGTVKTDPRDTGGRMPSRNLLIRYEEEAKKLYTPTAEFKKFVVRQGFSWADVVKQLKRAQIMLNDKRLKVLGAGVPLLSIQVACIEIDMNHPSLNGVARIVKEGPPNALENTGS